MDNGAWDLLILELVWDFGAIGRMRKQQEIQDEIMARRI